jgi:hypothetical protein
LLQSLGTAGIHPGSVTRNEVIDDHTWGVHRDDHLDVPIEMHSGRKPARPAAATNLDRQLGHDAAHDSRMS